MNIRAQPWGRYGVVLTVGAVVGLSVGWWLWHARPAPAEAPATAVVLPKTDAVALERRPAAAPPHKIIAAAKELHRKAKVERAAVITVQPTQENCTPVDVELGVVRMPDDTRRIVARTEDGTITGGVDIPLATEQVVKEMKWAAGVSYDPGNRTYGAFIDRDLGPFRLSAELRQSREQGATALVRVGVRF